MDIGIYVIQGMGINMYKAIGITALMAAVFIYDTFFYIPADENPLLMVPPKTKK